MPPEIVTFRSEAYHADFAKFRDRFNQEYRTRPLHDMRGVRIIFGSADFNGDNDCAHVCFGGSGKEDKSAADWKPERAKRILWIKAALQDTKRTTVHVGSASLERQDTRVYLFAASDNNPPKPEDECFMVVTVFKDAKTAYFLTAYPIEQSKLIRDRATLRREFPSTRPPKSQRK